MKMNDDQNRQNATRHQKRPSEVLPTMETYEEAVALTEKERDNFYIGAFKLKDWLADLLIQAFTRLAPGTRQPCGSPQTGQAWRGFLKIFGGFSDHEFPYAMRVVHRFIHCKHPLSELLLRAHAGVDIEHTLTGDYIGVNSGTNPVPVPLMRRTAERWCDWLDALIHLETHVRCQLGRRLPGVDRTSHIVAFGLPLCWLPKPPQLRDPLHPEAQCWPEREIDTLLIALQPLARVYRWTCGDLLRVVGKLVSNPLVYPCWSEADLARYRHKVLALPPLPPGPAPEDKDLFPAGFEVAICLCPPEHGVLPVQPIWS